MEELVGSIPAVPMYLEVGASSPTMISFMGLGLSRFTAGKLSGISRRQNMSQKEAKQWVSRQALESLEIPQASIREIRRLIFWLFAFLVGEIGWHNVRNACGTGFSTAFMSLKTRHVFRQ